MVAGPNSFVNLMDSTTMLGAMYGDFGFTLPFNPELGHFDAEQMQGGFIPGRGKMLRNGSILRTRIAALISLVDYYTFPKESLLYVGKGDGRSHRCGGGESFWLTARFTEADRGLYFRSEHSGAEAGR
jgi:hypothetical protein